MTDATNYVHGYSDREAQRLVDQAGAVRELLHRDTTYPAGARVLEAGCGVGAQTVTLAARSPDAHFVCLDVSEDSLAAARATVEAAGSTNVEFHHGDLFHLPFDPESFDHVFICYVLEHLAQPAEALAALRGALKPGGTITVIEGDHGSCYFHPETASAMKAWQCLIDAQARLGGDSLIGRRLYPLLAGAGYREVRVSPRMVYADRGLPLTMEAFWGKTIIPMVAGVEAQAVELGLITPGDWRAGLADLRRVVDSDEGTCCYTFFKALALK